MSVGTPWGRWLQILAIVITVILIAWPRPTRTPAEIDLSGLETTDDAPLSKVAVIGIDGADWSVIDLMIGRGELPILSGLIDRGAHGVLRSIDPTYSPVVWTTIFSGLRPDQHGILDWYTATAVNRKVPLLWELVGASRGAALALNVPGSWPPRDFPGAIVAGFPMPRLLVSETRIAGQFLGRVVSSESRSGIVPSVLWAGNRQDIPLGREQVLARSRIRHPVFEMGIQGRWLLGRVETLELIITDPLDTTGVLEVIANGQRFSLARGEWSPWIDIEVGGHPSFVRVDRLDSGDLYITPPFQSAIEPRFDFIAGDVPAERVAPDGRYVVEGVGWKAATDADLHDALAEHLEQVSDLQLRAAMALSEEPWDLFAYVFTLPDRISHGFWNAETIDPEILSKVDSQPGHADDNRVRNAYRRVDRDLGRLLAALGSDVTVFIASDHGFETDPSNGRGTHRDDGIFVAAGPGIAASSDRLELSVYDVAPTIIAGIGLPVAEDMAHRPFLDLFEDPVVPRFIASYGESADVREAEEQIDESTEEQLRALGYIE